MTTPTLTHLSYSSPSHRYYVKRDRDAKMVRAKGVTTLAKTLDDETRLTKWKLRKAVAGMGMRQDLVERAAAHHDDDDELEQIAEEALTAARANEAAARGTAAHRITERIDLAEMVVDSPQARAVAAAWAKALDDAGLEVIPEYVERVVVFPDLPLCGTFDRIFRRKFDGALVIGDLKTGARAIDYPHAIAVQLALYANAPYLAGKLDGQGKTSIFTPMPSVDKRRAYIIAMPSDETTVQVRPVDIEAGWETARNLIFPTLEWRARTDLVGPAMSASSVSPLADNIKGRLGLLKMVDGGVPAVVKAWPADVPTKAPWSEEQGKAIVAALTRVELALGTPF